MGNGLLIKTQKIISEESGESLPVIRKLEGLTEYDVFAFDALSTIAWPSQSDATISDEIYDLSGPISASPDPTKSATFNLDLDFDGGFQFTENSGQRIILPDVCMPASTSEGYASLTWALVSEDVRLTPIVGWATSGDFSWSVYKNSGVARQFVLYADGASATATLDASDFDIDIGGTNYALLLFCVGRVEDGSGGYLRRQRVYSRPNGVAFNASSAGPSSAEQSASPFPIVGQSAAVTTNGDIRVYRKRFLDVGTVTGVMTSDYFDQVCDEEFALNSGRDDWNIA